MYVRMHTTIALHMRRHFLTPVVGVRLYTVSTFVGGGASALCSPIILHMRRLRVRSATEDGNSFCNVSDAGGFLTGALAVTNACHDFSPTHRLSPEV